MGELVQFPGRHRAPEVDPGDAQDGRTAEDGAGRQGGIGQQLSVSRESIVDWDEHDTLVPGEVVLVADEGLTRAAVLVEVCSSGAVVQIL